MVEPEIYFHDIRRYPDGRFEMTAQCDDPYPRPAEFGVLALTMSIGPGHVDLFATRSPDWATRRITLLQRMMANRLRKTYIKQLLYKELQHIAAIEIRDHFFRPSPLLAYLREKGLIKDAFQGT